LSTDSLGSKLVKIPRELGLAEWRLVLGERKVKVGKDVTMEGRDKLSTREADVGGGRYKIRDNK
jgi:hypothetical protein